MTTPRTHAAKAAWTAEIESSTTDNPDLDYYHAALRWAEQLEIELAARQVVSAPNQDQKDALAGAVCAAQPSVTYSSTQATICAGCGDYKHTPLRQDHLGGYICLTCIDKQLAGMGRLVRAVWAAGFRAGKTNGEDAAASYERGGRSQKPQDPDSAWQEDVQWRIDTESENYRMDILNPDAWGDVP